ncbi:MAG: hypothetical protein IJD92_02670 [Bacilli bacterium]|nr:hypothetical protein [Bacilli bacterium]
MFIISSLIIESKLIYNLCNILGKTFSKIFKTSKYGIFVFLLSLISGSPSNAKYIKDLKDNNLITKEEGNKLLIFTTNYNPLLIISLLNLYLNKQTSYKILLIIVLSNIIVGIINRNEKIKILNNKNINKNIDISNIIKNTMDTLLMILGTLIFFNLIINILPTFNPLLKNIINGLLEITTALSSLKYININYTLKVLLSLVYLSFGGLSIHIQIKSIFTDTNYKLFFKSRLLTLIISMFLFLLFHSMKLL